MLLSCTTQNCVDSTTIVANIATIIGAFSIVVAVFSFFKNKVNKKHVKFTIKEIINACEADSKFLLLIENRTDKNFYITQIMLHNKNCVYSAKEIYSPYAKIYNLTDLEPIKVSAFECLNASPVFEIEKSEIAKNAKVIIQTTTGNKITLKVFDILNPKETDNSKPD